MGAEIAFLCYSGMSLSVTLQQLGFWRISQGQFGRAVSAGCKAFD
jgi:hypothetical protein